MEKIIKYIIRFFKTKKMNTAYSMPTEDFEKAPEYEQLTIESVGK